MTKAKKMSRPPVSWENDLSAEMAQFDQRQRACLRILADMARGEEVSEDEKNYLRFAGYSEPDIRRELGRMARALNQLGIAGTAEDRRIAAERLGMLEDETAGTIGAMKAERDRLDAEIANAEKRLTEARSEVDRRQSAVEQLRSEQLLPKHIANSLAAVRKRKNDSAPAKVAREAETRLQNIQAILKLSDRDGILRHCESLILSNGPNLLVTKNENSVISKTVDGAKWSQYFADLREEIPQREAELSAAAEELKFFDEESAAVADFYLNEFENQEA
jgi:hypothetical protein